MTAATGLPEADLAAIRGLIRDLRVKNHTRGVIAVAAVPQWSGEGEFSVDGQRIRVRTAPSVLAIRDAITNRREVDWVVILTDRDASELPAGVLEHLTGNRLSNFDPFPMLRDAFAASQHEFRLLDLDTRAARAVLRELGDTTTPAPGGVLTNEHVFATLAKLKFGLDPVEFTPHHVALWSIDVSRTQRFDTWSKTTEPALLEQFYAWISARLGTVGPLFTTVWRVNGPEHIVPLGMVAALLSDSAKAAASFPATADVIVEVRTRLKLELGDNVYSEQQLATWGNVATLAVTAAEDPTAALTRAESFVTKLHASPLVARSDVLSSALAPRIKHFAGALATSIDSDDLAPAENAWADVLAHRDARADTSDAPRDVQVGAAALRLLRRLRAPWQQPTTLADWLQEHRTDLSWVDSAVNNAFVGATDPQLAAVAHKLVTEIREKRAALDRSFARMLAAAGTHRESGTGAPLYIEDVLDQIVKPLTAPVSGPTGLGAHEAQASPVLVVVADGMDAATSHDVVADALRRHRPQWQDCRFTGADGPHTALATLPTVTKFSRCSLLTGALAAGTQDVERTGFLNWLQHNGLRGTGQVLFHKADLEAVAQGHALAVDVRTAVEDTDDRPVVACILNDIDDALDRSDPIGTSWTTSTFKRLDALLATAATVGRTVVLLSDHGHVVERREQASKQRGQQISARYRSAVSVDGASLPADEVLVEGQRVLTEDHRAVLAVDEQLRYTGLKAGYHGGATLAEAVIPISILVNGTVSVDGYVSRHLGLEAAPNPQPSWWTPARITSAPVTQVHVSAPTATKKKAATKMPQVDTLFDVGEPESLVASPDSSPTEGHDQVAKLLTSALFKEQFKLYGRRMSTDAIGTLLRETIAGGGVLTLPRAGEILGVKASRANSSVQVVAQIFNTDGVIVLTVNGGELALEAPLMFEQFQVKA
ncbi:BREX-2 system phosphatase PglZ [Gordonia amicalis]|uniref:BREX-2 system phosphatase PglZ n=1 Tax=Gordonia amicalis TaxID=89053 RepID=UPI003A813674